MARAKTSGVSGPLSRTEIVTVRLDPKLRYMAELGARRQRRTISSFIEWSVEQGLRALELSTAEDASSAWEESDYLWDVDDADRFVKLALRYPDLLTHQEQVLWKVIRECGWAWKGKHNDEGDWVWKPSENSIVVDRVREYWTDFQAAAGGDLEAKNRLPVSSKKAPTTKPTKKGNFDDLEDDIPF